MQIKYFIVFLSLIFVISCKNKDIPKTLDKSPVLAKVNDYPITANQFNEKVKDIERYLKLNTDVYKERERLLKSMISTELIYQNALKENMQNDPQFKEYLVTHYLKRKVPQSEVSDEKAKAIFDSNSTKMESIRASHILIKPSDANNPDSWKEAEKKAAGLFSEILSGSDFAEMAKKHSQDPANAPKGGDLGWFARAKMVKEFSDAAFALENIGDVSKVVKTQFGFHIIKLTGSKRGFDEFKAAIKERLSLDKNKEQYEEFIKKIQSQADIKIFEDALKNLKIVKQPSLTN